MNQCVPSWDIEENPSLHLQVLSSKTQLKTNDFLLHDIPTVDFEIAELTWKDGHLGMHGFGVPKLHTKAKENVYSPAPAAAGSSARCSWDKPLVAGDTLESLVNQATIPSSKSRVDDVVAGVGDEQLVSWFDSRKPPCMPESLPVIATTYLVGSSTLMGSCSGAPTLMEESGGGKEASRVAAAARLSRDWSSRVAEQSISGGGSGATRGGRESHQASYDTCEIEVCNNTTTGFTFSTTSLGSPGNTTSSAKDGTRTTVDDFDSVCHSRNQGGEGKEEDKKKVTVSGKRSRCAAVHNQSERKRRDKINQRMSILQKLVPNSSKTDKASMLDEVIEYMKQLQGKVEMMNRMNMSSMMLPLALQQQLQMTMMPPMGMGMGIGSMNMGMGINVMDINSMTRPGMAPQGFYPNPYMSMASSWDHMPLQSTSSMTIDPLSNASFLASQSQPSMTMDAYTRMAALYQQQQQFQASAAAAATSNKAI